MESSIEFPPVDPSVRADLRVAIESMPASRWLGLRIIGFDPKGISRIDMDVRPEMTFDGVSVQGNIAPAAGERLVAIGRAVSVGRTVGVSRADVYALRDGVWTLVTIATTTARLFDAAGRG
jgi:acyl-coenzyme A thioesterase PaaI-like protein